jgi:hypothetical protein
MVRAVREIVQQVDARMPMLKVMTQAAEIDRKMNQEIVFARLCSGFAILALIMVKQVQGSATVS